MNFWLGAVALTLMASGFVLAPWVLRERRRGDRHDANIVAAKIRLAEIERDFAAGALDETGYRQLLLEQQRRLLQEAGTPDGAQPNRRGRGVLVAVALILPLFAAAFYFHFGNWSDWHIQQLLDRSQHEAQAGEDNRKTLENLGKALQQRLAQRSDDDGRRRFMLARIDSEFGHYADAMTQFSLLMKQFPEDPAIAAQYAQALYLASGRELTPEVLAQAQRALRIDPDQTTALGLLGIAAFERQDYAQALLRWRHLSRLLPVDSPNMALIEHGIKEAQQQLGDAGMPGPKITVSVSLADALATARPAHGTLFVFAKAVGGPPMPLAVARLDPARLPLAVTLDDSMAMAAGVNLSSAKRVQVFARITASGQVRGETGDLEGSSAPLTLQKTASTIALVIDRRL